MVQRTSFEQLHCRCKRCSASTRSAERRASSWTQATALRTACRSTKVSPSSRRTQCVCARSRAQNDACRIQRVDVAGRDVTRYLNLLLRKEGHIFHRSSEFEIVRDIKEQICQVAQTPPNAQTHTHSKAEEREVRTPVRARVLLHASDERHLQPKTYTLPDGTTLNISHAHWQAPEVLFRPELIGVEYSGVSSCVYNAIKVRKLLRARFTTRARVFRRRITSCGGSSTRILCSAAAQRFFPALAIG